MQKSKLQLDIINDYLEKFNCNSRIHIFQELASTNSYILENLAILHDNDVIVAEMQTAGRGRFANKWFSEPFVGLTFSLLKVFPKNINLSTLPLVVSIALIRILTEFKIPARIKWPNDILHPDGSKIAGVLVESRVNVANLEKKNIIQQQSVIIGIGINDHFNIERNLLLASFLKHLNDVIDKFIYNDFTVFKEEWLDNCIHFNKNVGIYQNTQLTASGINVGLSESGAILIKTDNGIIKEFASASIRFEI